MFRYAILAVVTVLPIVTPFPRANADDAPEIEPARNRSDTPSELGEPAIEPVRVSFRLADGVRVTGELTHWDDEGIDGSFGGREWSDIHYDDVWRLHRRLMDQRNPAAWVNLGRVLLLIAIETERAGPLAENAFREATRLDPKAQELVDIARDEVEQTVHMREEIDAAIEEAKLETLSPESKEWKPDPWGPLSPEEHEIAVEAMQADAAKILERAGLTIEPVETTYFLFYSDMPRRESAKWVKELDIMYAKLAEQFKLAPGENIFWGKAVIFVFNQRDRFRLVEAESFSHFAPEWVDGFCHPIGPKVFVNFYRQPRDVDFAAVLVHETVHGFMHRYRTPRRLPTWANEGFADYFAATLFRGSPIDEGRRREGLAYIRRDGDVNAIINMDYRDGSWPGANSIGYPIGYLLVELMIRDRPQAFGDWVNAVKAGKNWELALVEDFGVTLEHLVERFVQFYKVNN